MSRQRSVEWSANAVTGNVACPLSPAVGNTGGNDLHPLPLAGRMARKGGDEIPVKPPLECVGSKP
jgi:hypothetical protein